MGYTYYRHMQRTHEAETRLEGLLPPAEPGVKEGIKLKYLSRLATRQHIVRLSRAKGETSMAFYMNPERGMVVMHNAMLDRNLSSRESIRRVKGMFAKMMALAREKGVKRVEQDYTIISPNVARRFGFERIGREGKFNKYGRELR